MANKAYLGDGCYVEHDGYQLILTTSNGFEDTNSIALEPEVYTALVRYADRLKNAAKEGNDGE